MFCNKCGTELTDDSVFCSKCGNKIGGAAEEKPEMTIMEKRYEKAFSLIVKFYKTPGACKWPRYNDSMLKSGPVRVDGEDANGNRKLAVEISPQNLTFIETFIDAQNSYGALLREDLLIVLNENGIPVRVLTKVKVSAVTPGLLRFAQKKALSINGGEYWKNFIKFDINQWVDD